MDKQTDPIEEMLGSYYAINIKTKGMAPRKSVSWLCRTIYSFHLLLMYNI